MTHAGRLLWLTFTVAAQVPPPNAGARVGDDLRAEFRTVLERETAEIKGLASRYRDDAKAVRALGQALPRGSEADGATRFATIPEVVPPRPAVVAPLASPAWLKELWAVRAKAARDLFALANRAASSSPRHYATADACLRAVLDCEPDHAVARRLLGQVPYKGGWATPYAIEQVEQGMVLHSRYGWVQADWSAHLERKELPAPSTGDGGKERWLPAAEADALRRDFSRGWQIRTEHFQVQTNVALDEAIAFGRHLETLQQVFEALFADVIGDECPLAQRYRSKTAARAKTAPHQVAYYAERDQYVAAVRPFQGDDAERSLGTYQPPQKGRSRRGQAYFFRDPDGQLDVTATLYHEGSHQLLFESNVSGPNDFRKNAGNFWVFEGLGTYFESLAPHDDGTVSIGGLGGPRLVEARKNLVEKHRAVPLDAFVAFGEARFNDDGIYLHYQQAAALATYLMQGRGEALREGFLAYVRDACRGRLQGGSGRGLDDRVKAPYDVLEAGMLDHLRGPAPAPRPAEAP